MSTCLLAPAANARVVDLRAGLRAGGLTGRSSAPTSPSRRNFFETVRGPAAGVEVGVSFLVLDLSVSFLQVLSGQGEISQPGQRLNGADGEIGPPGNGLDGPSSGIAGGTLTQVMLGFERQFTVAPSLVLRPRLAAGIAIGTGKPVSWPLSQDDVSHKGLAGQAQVGLERFLSPVLAVGVEVSGGYHYFLGGDQVVNDARNWGRGIQVSAFLTMTAHLGL